MSYFTMSEAEHAEINAAREAAEKRFGPLREFREKAEIEHATARQKEIERKAAERIAHARKLRKLAKERSTLRAYFASRRFYPDADQMGAE